MLRELIFHHNLVKRVINLFGTPWKWIASTPDYVDFKVTTYKLVKIITNINEQTEINSILCENVFTNLTFMRNSYKSNE